MDTSRIRTNLLRGGVSLAALAAAWGMPMSAQAQTCRTAAAIDGVAAGTDVTCPFSDVLTFPGGVSQGPGGVPNGSQLLGVANGTDPTHQQWTYNDPNGNLQFIFLSGDYNLRNGIGGTTVLEGAAILDLSGAGLCGAGGLQCPGGTGPNVATSNFTGSAGGGVGGTFLGQPVLDPFAGNGGFQQASADASGQAICDAMPAGASCGGSFHYGPAFDASTAPGTGAPESSPDLTISGQWFDDYLLDVDALPDDVAEDYRSCSQSGASACAVVFDDQGTPFVYGPDLAGGTFERVPVAPLVIVTDGLGNTAADFGYTWNVTVAPEGAGYDLGAVLRQHETNAELLQNVSNNAAATGAGAQGAFSIPGLADGFLLTQPTTSPTQSAADNAYVYSVPVRPAGVYSFFDLGFGLGTFYVDRETLPEVVAVTPGRNASGTNPKTSFVLTFSEPMDTVTVEDNFTVFGFTTSQFTVDGEGGTADENVTRESRSTDVWDESAFDIEWNSDDTEATFTFRDESPDGGGASGGGAYDESGSTLETTELDYIDDDGGVESVLDTEKGPLEGLSVYVALDPSGLNEDGTISFDTQKVFDAREYADELAAGATPATATAGALAMIFSLDVAPANGVQASQAGDARTAGVPLPDGDRRDLFGPSQ